ncbi:MAG: hypothetical protein HeimC2_13370 [Candidatus Heimdallarchaeota archaeon LC_2]|nr:MAG: hypothetical protein HeimC2_13370 [Candidatus Heimdallarchaeota archaeon LC_2]
MENELNMAKTIYKIINFSQINEHGVITKSIPDKIIRIIDILLFYFDYNFFSKSNIRY